METKRTFTRQELYDLVWSRPIQKLAAEFGLSDKGLAKICSKHLIPAPPRGYWAKLDAGQKPKRAPLPPVENVALHTVQVGRTKSRMSESVLAAVTAAKTQALAVKAANRGTPANLDDGTIMIEDPGATPHHSIAPVIKELCKARPNDEGVVSASGVIVHQRTTQRAASILHNLARACEGKGATIAAGVHALQITTEAGSVSVTLSEERRRQKHVPTAEEKAEHQRNQAKRARDPSRRVWDLLGRTEPWPEFDIIHTGKLTLGYAGYQPDGLRKSWSDGKTQSIEGMLLSIVDGLALIIVANKERDRIAAEQNRRRLAIQHRRQLATQRGEREKKRLDYLRWVADTRREVEDLRATIAAVPQQGEVPPDYGRMIEWAKQRLEILESQTTIARIQQTLVQDQLYPEPDPLHDPEGDPPPKLNYWDD